jgi:hypothetical protein
MESANYRELRLLSEVYNFPDATQRDLSRRLGIALGLTNALLRNLAQKGYIRVTHARWKRWLYALTPQGFTRKIHLTVSYIHRFLDHYQTVRQTLRQELAPLSLNAESRVAIFGSGELAELVYLGLREAGIEEIDIYAPTTVTNGKFLGMGVKHLDGLSPADYDRVIIAALQGVEQKRGQLALRGVPHEKIVTLLPEATEDGDGL